MKNDNNCTGSLIVKHSSPESLGNYHRLYLSEKNEYRNIRKKFSILKKHIIVGMRAEGTCCWEVFPKRRHQGETKQILTPDDDHLPQFQVISARKKICNE